MSIGLDYGDKIEVAPDEEGDLAIKITQTAWVEEPQWIRFCRSKHDRDSLIDELIEALEKIQKAADLS